MIDDTIPRILIQISAALVLVLLIAVARMKNKQKIHYFSFVLIFMIFVWSIGLIADMYASTLFNYSGMFFVNIYFSAVAYVSVFLFYLGFSFASVVEFKKYYYLLNASLRFVKNDLLPSPTISPLLSAIFFKTSTSSLESLVGIFTLTFII